MKTDHGSEPLELEPSQPRPQIHTVDRRQLIAPLRDPLAPSKEPLLIEAPPPSPRLHLPSDLDVGPTSRLPKTARESMPPPSGRLDRLERMSMPPPSLGRRSLAPALPGVRVNAKESTLGSVEVVAGTAGALARLEAAQVLKQLQAVGVQSLGFVSLVLGFVGSILVYQAGLQALRIVPDTSSVGPMYIELLVKDLAATITGLMLATRVGAGIAAEIGSMRVTDQLDALRLCRTDPVDYLVAPRLVASLIATPFLTVFGGTVAALTGAATGYWAFGINPAGFLDPRYLDLGDVITGLVKSIAYGVAIPLVSAHAGLYTTGGSEGVGNATTRAVVGSSLAVIVLGFFIGALGQVLLP